MFEVGKTVDVVDRDKLLEDSFLEEEALEIIIQNGFKGEVTKVYNDIHFVSFKNDLGLVTQGYRFDEIKEVV